MADERLTDDEVALVLRRASELDVRPASLDGAGLPVTAVEAAAAEVGLSPAAVRRAVAELRAGALDDEPDGTPSIVCARVVPAAADDALASVATWLRGQAMVRARDRGSEQVWRPREDVFARIQRKVDPVKRLRLIGVDEVVVRAVAVEGGTLVRIRARLTRPSTRAPRRTAGAGAAAGVAAAGFVGGLVVDPAVLGAVASGVPAGAGLGVLGWRIGRARLARARHRVTEAVDGLLDELELGRGPASPRARIEQLAERARRLRGGYRL